MKMEYALLRSLRSLGPGLILLGYLDLWRVIVLGASPAVWALDTSKIVLIAYIVGGVYGAVTPRLKRDRIAFRGVQKALISGLSSIDPSFFSFGWKEVSPIFYQLVDNDNSLGIKAQGVYFNGLIVTTSFDSIVISSLSLLVGLVIGILACSWLFGLTSLSVLILSILVWRVSLARHISLGDSQINVIRHRYSKEVKEYASLLIASSRSVV
jgi:hypothetical protein